MRRTIVGAVATITAATVAVVSGMGLISTASATPLHTSSVVAGIVSPTVEANVVQSLHDQLYAAAKSGDVAGTQKVVNQIAIEMTKLSTPQGRAALTASASTTVGRAAQENDQVNQALANIEAGKSVTLHTTVSPQDTLPPLPGPLAAISQLLNSLLSTLMNLITGLLGGLPVPVPVPTP